ncbi:hypothetical protein [Agromyces atrinae]|uniref:Uncharacterized protein n=1 Tax=Agromyces atrinae TaxID=592376 RepID=A0A4Q2MAB1_9MICO|nr:hypothetical protein [Agromyces atrinae]NYD67266.1 hypothetical protein [Agromyces atrinae]RXZ86902.1 hypothetical protein ESP50_07515 [Agromyces atrinae]
MSDDTTRPLDTERLDTGVDSGVDDAETLVLEPAAETEQTWAQPPYVEAATPVAAAAPVERPRVRWAGILWGLVFTATAAIAIALLVDPVRRDDADVWLRTQTPGTIALYGLLALGAIILVSGLVGVIRRLQRRTP